MFRFNIPAISLGRPASTVTAARTTPIRLPIHLHHTHSNTPNNTIFIAPLSASVHDKWLRKEVGQYISDESQILECRAVHDVKYRRKFGFGFVKLAQRELMEDLLGMGSITIDGITARVERAKKPVTLHPPSPIIYLKITNQNSTPDDIRNFLEPFGEIERVHRPLIKANKDKDNTSNADKNSSSSYPYKPFAIVVFKDQESATRLVEVSRQEVLLLEGRRIFAEYGKKPEIKKEKEMMELDGVKKERIEGESAKEG